MKTIAYMRVSSPKRNGRSRQKTDSQKLALRRYCQAHGIKRPTYIEDHSTGRNQDREGFQSVMQQARDGKLGCLVIWKLDRLGRSMIQVVRTLQELMQLNVTIAVTSQGLTFDDSPFSIFLQQLWASLSELESNMTSERIKAGLRATTKTLGRPIDKKKRDKLSRWNKAKVPVKTQAKRLGITAAAVYAMRKRMEL